MAQNGLRRAFDLRQQGLYGQNPQLAQWLPFVKSMDRRDGKATAYVCEDYACKLPTADLQTAARLLDGQER